MADGWIKIHRSIQQNWIWKDPIKFSWWMDILLNVNYSDAKVNIGYELFDCKRGQSIMSLQSWALRWKTSKDTARNFLKLLEKDGMISHESIGKSTRITVCKYEEYQADLHDSQTPPKRKPNANSPKQEREEEKERKKIENANKLATRSKEFGQSLLPFVDVYTNDMLRAFLNYWSEPNITNTKMKFEMCPTWNTAMRLATWASKEKTFTKNKPNEPTTNYKFIKTD